MQIFFCTLLFLIQIRDVSPTKNNLKPSFYPYCLAEERCVSACNCDIYPNCVLLTMDDSIRNSILYYHNQIREIQSGTEIKPAAMAQLDYDLELEEISKCWASRCEQGYSDCFMTSRFSETSQSFIQTVLMNNQEPNIFTWMKVMNKWLGRIRNLPDKVIMNPPTEEEEETYHNYFQVISDRVLTIGCAWSAYGNRITLVCTYGPRASRPGELIYISGAPCSLCPGGYSCDYNEPFNHLCKLKIYSAEKIPEIPTMGYQVPPPIPPAPVSVSGRGANPGEPPVPPPPEDDESTTLSGRKRFRRSRSMDLKQFISFSPLLLFGLEVFILLR